MSQQRDRRSSSRFVVPAAILTAVWAGSFAGTPANADTFTWNGNTGNFSDPTQWAGGVAPTGLSPNDTLVFGGASTYTATSNIAPASGTLPDFYYGTLNIANTGGFAGIVPGVPTQFRTLTNSTLNYSGTSDFMFAPVFSVARGATLNVNVAAGSGILSLANRTTPTALEAHVLSGEGNVVINNLSSNPVYLGNLGTLAGNLNVTAGVVRAADGDGVSTLDSGVATKGGDTLSNLTVVTVAAGAEYDINGNGEQMGGIAGAGTFRVGPAGGITLNYIGNLTFDGQIVSNGTGGVAKGVDSGTSTYTFRGDNTYTNTTNVAAGTLVLSGAGKLSGSSAITVASGANLTLDNSAQNVNDRLNPAAPLTVVGNFSILGAPGQATTQTLAALVPQNAAAGGTATINVVNGAGGGTTTLTVGTMNRTGRSAAVNFTGDGSVFINSPAITNGIIGGWATVNGAAWATVDGSNKVVPYAAYQTSADTSNWTSTDNVKVTGPVTGTADTATNGNSINTLHLASTDHVSIGTTLAVNGGGILATETTAIDGPGTIYGNMPAAWGNSDLILNVAASKTLTLNAQIANTLSNGLIKGGDGTLVLTGPNAYDADTRIIGGTLSVAADSAIGSGSSIRINNNSTFKITGSGFTTSKALRLDGAGGTIDTGPNDATFNGTVANNGKLTKVGTGTLIVKLPNAGSDIDILEGGIRTGQGDTLGNGTLVTIAAGAFLDLSTDTSGEDFGAVAGAGELRIRTTGTSAWAGSNDPDLTFSGKIIPYSAGAPATTGTNLGNVAKTGLGTLTLSGASTYTGTTRVGSGILVAAADVLPNVPGPFGNASSAIQVGLTPATTTGVGDLLSAASLMIGLPNVTVARDVSVLNPVGGGQTFSGAVSIGASHASGSSTYSGAITLNRGAELSVPSASATTSLTGVISGSGGLVKVGAGSAVLSGANTHSGGTAVLAGTLTVTLPASLGAGPVVVTGGTLAAAPGMAAPLTPSSLSLSGAGTLDLNDNDMILDYSSTSPLAAVKAAISAARNGGTWTGAGITSTSAKNIAGGTTTLAAVEASDLGAASFDSVPVDATAVLVKYTYYGDLNLDGRINADDYALIDRGAAKGLSGWINGDVDYSGAVTSADYLLMDNAFGHQTGTLSPDFLAMRESQFGGDYVQSLIASVPEPTSLFAACGLALPLLSRRRRQT